MPITKRNCSMRNTNKISKPLTKENAILLLEKMPVDAEIFSEGKFFKSNQSGTGLLAWSETLNKWIMWLHKESKPVEVFTHLEIINASKN